MKTRRLPDLDLARFAVMPTQHKWAGLKAFKLGHPPFTYAPLRAILLDALNVMPGGLPAGDRTPLNKIKLIIAGLAQMPDDPEEKPVGLLANIAAAEGLYAFAVDCETSGRTEEFNPIKTLHHNHSYWLNAVLSIKGRKSVILIDPRRGGGLTAEGRRFVFSAMHQNIREADPDYADAQFGIVQLSGKGSEPRVARLHTDQGIDLFDYASLDKMMLETYAIWHEILAGRQQETRQYDGSNDPIFGAVS